MYLAWFDADRKKPVGTKIAEAHERYVAKFGRQPLVCLVNPEDAIADAGIELRPLSSIGRNCFWIGADDAADAEAEAAAAAAQATVKDPTRPDAREEGKGATAGARRGARADTDDPARGRGDRTGPEGARPEGRERRDARRRGDTDPEDPRSEVAHASGSHGDPASRREPTRAGP